MRFRKPRKLGAVSASWLNVDGCVLEWIAATCLYLLMSTGAPFVVPLPFSRVTLRPTAGFSCRRLRAGEVAVSTLVVVEDSIPRKVLSSDYLGSR